MEDEDVAKAPVTRRRRRLSVEQSDDAKSSSAPNTPTKKRVTRRTAKPELDLIDENAPGNITPKNLTKKTNMKELEAEERPLTPSRRSARVKSNSSIILETTQASDTPRAKRAARRNSQVGSDNEGSLTPARQTRRTRKDSANAEKAEPPPSSKTTVPTTEVIVEEPDTLIQKSQSDAHNGTEEVHSSTTLRKSPRLSQKHNNTNNVKETNEKNENDSIDLKINKSANFIESSDKETVHSEDLNNSNKENKINSEELPINVSKQVKEDDSMNNLVNVECNRLSLSSIELLKELNTEPNKINNFINKSCSVVIESRIVDTPLKRSRTKSWTNSSIPVEYDNKCHSDTESVKKKERLFNTSNNTETKNISPNLKNILSNKERKSVLDTSGKEIKADLIETPTKKENLMSSTASALNNSRTSSLFDKIPGSDLQVMVYIEEGDNNLEKVTTDKQVKDDDQCVPIIQNDFVSHEPIQQKEMKVDIFTNQKEDETYNFNNSDSCEPMDVDESIIENVTSNKSSLKTLGTSDNYISLQGNNEMNCSDNKKDKSKLIFNSNASEALDKTANENKNTLVLSQLKDISNEINVSQASHSATESKLSISNHTLNVTKDSEKKQTKISLKYSTSTPLQQKTLIKQIKQVNTSGITSNNTSKIHKSFNNSITNKSSTNTSKNLSEQSESENESSKAENSLVYDEAEEASDDYESGDSRDDEERQYEKENEIVQPGETLTSGDELSNDTDYEKDSFVVSSSDEDKELLDGSGDDLSMSDKELKMTTKSKKKYNKRKMKEQKSASRQMYESRHKINVSNSSKKAEVIRKKKTRTISNSSDSEDNDIQIKKKKNSNRMRLDSSHEISMNKSLENNSENQGQHLSKSVTSDVEMSVIDDNANDKTDSLARNIKQEKQSLKKEPNTSIHFIDAENPKQKEDDKNKSNQTLTAVTDPLDDSNSSASSDSGDNIHIQNYDSILNDLNKSVTTKKHKKGDISLNNLDKKTKQKSIPVIDQLNLTGTKLISLKETKQVELSLGNNNSRNGKTNKESKVLVKMSSHEGDSHSFDNKEALDSSKLNKSNDDERGSDSSSSIDLHLLCSEDSPAEAKNDILENSDNDTEVQFFIDTKGTHSTVLDKSLNTDPLKKNKKEKKRMSIDNEDADKNSDSDTPMEVSNRNANELHEKSIDTSSTAPNKSITKSPKSDKKKKRIAKNETTKLIDNDSDSDAPMGVSNISATKLSGKLNEFINKSSTTPNKSIRKTPKSDKKKKRKSENETTALIDDADTSINKSVVKTPQSEKKNPMIAESQAVDEKDKNSDSDAPVEVSNRHATEQYEKEVLQIVNTSSVESNKSITKTPKSDQKEKRISNNETTEPIVKTSESDTPMGVTNINVTEMCVEQVHQTADTSITASKSVTKSPKSDKKKKRISEHETTEPIGKADNSINPINVIKISKNEKKKNKTTVFQSVDGIDEPHTAEMTTIEKPAHDTQDDVNNQNSKTNKTVTKHPNGEKKKKSKKMSQSNDTDDIVNVSETKDEMVISKKRKRNSPFSNKDKNLEVEGLSHLNMSKQDSDETSTTNNQNKKRKISQNIEDSEYIEQDLSTKKGGKKRKEREDDEGNKTTKVLKLDTQDKLQVRRLPKSILNKLEDKPTKSKIAPKSISTTDFTVEVTKVKKIKPSHYLEESVYINDDETQKSKKQKRIKTPKVLPFLPTVSTSNSGCTTNFIINVLPKEIQFVAKSSDVNNYKNNYLENKKFKRLGTFELYKRNRNIKMSKF